MNITDAPTAKITGATTAATAAGASQILTADVYYGDWFFQVTATQDVRFHTDVYLVKVTGQSEPHSAIDRYEGRIGCIKRERSGWTAMVYGPHGTVPFQTTLRPSRDAALTALFDLAWDNADRGAPAPEVGTRGPA